MATNFKHSMIINENEGSVEFVVQKTSELESLKKIGVTVIDSVGMSDSEIQFYINQNIVPKGLIYIFENGIINSDTKVSATEVDDTSIDTVYYIKDIINV